ncbi:MAG: tryptophan synthase subunit alpha [Acidobacteria bacterium]|nr:tryptophan synthase subunit alpha [Acidobacteriota bacterium]
MPRRRKSKARQNLRPAGSILNGPRGLRAAFRHGRRGKTPALVAYLTVGDPNLKFTQALVLRLAEAGADVIELGVPFSDPIADGPVIQRASERALRAGTTLAEVLKLAGRIRKRSRVPLVVFSYFNPVLQMGVERFAARAAAAGIAGVLITDLTPEEADGFVRTMRRHGLATVFLAAPTSTNGRLRVIARLSRGFVYAISRRGVTGPRTEVSAEATKLVRRLRRVTRLPVAVGFGIAQAEQVTALNGVADGVVVGSALVECCERAGHGEAGLEAAAELLQELKGYPKGRS